MRKIRLTEYVGVKFMPSERKRLESISDERELTLSALVRGYVLEGLAKDEMSGVTS